MNIKLLKTIIDIAYEENKNLRNDALISDLYYEEEIEDLKNQIKKLGGDVSLEGSK